VMPRNQVGSELCLSPVVNYMVLVNCNM